MYDAPGRSVPQRIAGLDGVRAYAVLAVIAAHAYVPWLHGGGVGVDVFFGISGFLITYLLLREGASRGAVDLGRFWLRRVLRLYPALIVLVALVDVFALAIGMFRPDSVFLQAIPATPSVLFYFSNWMIVGTHSAFLGPFGPLWSLSVEEQFYLVWPLIVMVALRAPRPRALLAVIAGAAIVVAAAHRAVTFDSTDLLRTFGTDFRVDMLLIGVLLAVALSTGRLRVVRIASAIAIAPAVAYILVISVIVPEFGAESSRPGEQLYYTLGLPLVGLSTATIIAFLVTHQQSRFAHVLSWRPLAYTGRISYGMYLWHFPVIFALNAVGVHQPNLVLAITVVLTYIVASASWYLVELPLHRRFHERLRSAPRATTTRVASQHA